MEYLQGKSNNNSKACKKSSSKGGIMKPKTSENEEGQLELGKVLLETFLNMKDELILLGKAIDWKHFCERFGESFHKSQGRLGLPTRLMVGLTYLKYLHNLSDEQVIKQWLQNPY